VPRRPPGAGNSDHHLTLAIGYDGRLEVVEAVRSLLADPDLVIRTSGERRLGGFLRALRAYAARRVNART
jgi:undecaprenyl pyrophosphate synthase